MDHKDIWLRALKTAAQAAIAAFLVNPGFNKGVVMSVLAAAASAGWNYLNALKQ